VRGRRHQQCLAWYAAEEDNLRSMLDSLSEFASLEAASAAYLLLPFWGGRGAFSEARDRYKTLLTDSDLPDESRAMLFERLADVEERLGDLDAADAAVREALTLAASTGAQPVLADALRISAWVASRRDDSDEAIRLARCAVEEAASLDPERRIHALHDLGSILADLGHHEEARVVLRRSTEEARSAGHVLSEVSTAVNLGYVELHERDFEQAQATFASALEQNRKVSHYTSGVYGLMGLGHALLGLNRHREARIAFAEMLELILAGRRPVILDLTFAASGIALAAERINFTNAARIRGAVEQLRQGVEFSSEDDDLERLFEQTLADTLGDKAYAREKAIGAAMSLDETIELARSLASS
jgi:tetratricopeptide (TPR) repeat protein